MYYDKRKVVEVAESQLGYHEKASNSQLDDPTANSGSNNWNKYARDLDALGDFYNGRKNIGGDSAAWCDIFVDWAFTQAYGRAGAQFLLCQPDKSCGAGCSFSAQYFNARGQFYKSNPQVGDQIFFGAAWNNIWHTGLVVAVGNGTVVTIEGNSSDRVQRCIYTQSDKNIWGYGRPDWGTPASGEDNNVPTTETPQKPTEAPQPSVYEYNVKLPLVMIGDKGGYVYAIQTLLIARGYDCGNKPLIGAEKPDGDFGKCTEKAVAFFQSKSGLADIDGEVGGETWTALLKNWG